MRRSFSAILLSFVLVLSLADCVRAQVPTALYNFTNGVDGADPEAGLIEDSLGNLYGTSSTGGRGFGTVFMLSPFGSGWAFRVIYTFQGGADGATPLAPLTLDNEGNLYGSTYEGGIAEGDQGFGVIFRLSPRESGEWRETVLHAFDSFQDSHPTGRISIGKSGELYGTTSGGEGCGPRSAGAVFELSPSADEAVWTEQILYAFGQEDDLTCPRTGVTIDKFGNLYGTTTGFGLFKGAVFKMEPGADGKWVLSTVHQFAGADGASPRGELVVDDAGVLFGTTNSGGPSGNGVVFKLEYSSQAWQYKILHEFATELPNPFGGLVKIQESFYGTTRNNGGSVFRLLPFGEEWNFQTLYTFNGTNGAFPQGLLLVGTGGTLYGTTSGGGSTDGTCGPSGCGTVYGLEVLGGQISVKTNLTDASFSVLGPSRLFGSGTDYLFPNVQPGTYQIVFDSVPGYNTPIGETQDLLPGGAISFQGIYTPSHPHIGDIQPTQGHPGDVIKNFTVTGDNFDPGTTLSFSGTGVAAAKYFTRTDQKLVAEVRVSNGAALGPRSVILTNGNGAFGVVDRAFTIVPRETLPETCIPDRNYTPMPIEFSCGLAEWGKQGTALSFADGEMLQLTCSAGLWHLPAYMLWYTNRDGGTSRIAQCLFLEGFNDAAYLSGHLADGRSCLAWVDWLNIDGGRNDGLPKTAPDFAGNEVVVVHPEEPYLDTVRFEFDANQQKLSWENEKYNYPNVTEIADQSTASDIANGHLRPVLTFREDPVPGPELDSIFDSILSQMQSGGSGPMVPLTLPRVSCTGGYLNVAGTRASFAFNIMYTGQVSTFTYNFRNANFAIQLVSTAVSRIDVESEAHRVTFSGLARVNGVAGYSYTAVVVDGGPVGSNSDKLSVIVTGPSGYYYSASGILSGGDIRLAP